MTGQTDLNFLLAGMDPLLRPEDYVFCTMPDALYGDMSHLSPLACFQEAEGLTLILEKQKAEASGLSYTGVFRCITLRVHSSLTAVGLTAAVSTALAKREISANIVAAFFHDHIFVPEAQASTAMSVLRHLSLQEAKGFEGHSV